MQVQALQVQRRVELRLSEPCEAEGRILSELTQRGAKLDVLELNLVVQPWCRKQELPAAAAANASYCSASVKPTRRLPQLNSHELR